MNDHADYIEWAQAKAQRERGKPMRASTVRARRSHLTSSDLRASYLPGEPSLAEALSNREDTEALLAMLRKDLAAGTMRNCVQVLREFGEFSVERGVIDSCALTTKDTPRVRRTPTVDVYTDEETELLVEAAAMASPRLRMLVLSLVDTGMRVGEALSLEWDHVRLGQVPPVYALPTTKTEPRLVVMTPRLWNAWQEPGLMHGLQDGAARERDRTGARQRRRYIRDPETFVFPQSYAAVHDVWPKLCWDAGIPNRGIHTVRHAYAHRLLAAGHDLFKVSKMLGHSSVTTTAEYYGHVSSTSYASLQGW